MTERKSTRDYWDENWRLAGDGLAAHRSESYFWRRLNRVFRGAFSGLPPEAELIELGAGASEWLPRLHRDFGVRVCGLDYSEPGCERARQILAQAGISGEIFHGDMFQPPAVLQGRFDAVCSFGLVEHFADTASAVKACAAFAKPGGTVFTLIPNMTGVNGFFYKLLNRAVFETHVPLTLDDLRRAHVEAGLEPLHASYLLGLPGILDPNRLETVLWRRALRFVVSRFSQFVWWFEERGMGVPENQKTSPYIVCVARVPQP